MKFDTQKYWKHADCMDVFISVTGVSFDDDGRHSFLWVNWMTQGTAGYWASSMGDRIKITPENYEKWKPYKIRGNYRFE